ncbi:hypothetical protein GLAREA_00860 [Glarea lozoyensis ATCC 20868]|uniref:Serine-rich protein n=1 Tax=Glarea lozoyensis (strain ATCC 20868 / MF5171) TaxID=1116229 RepID=S3CVM9_GLAL2|nr:uncharacterized protein GLAREA_00860 [Glarea lozoyensis ATCC 20868]EPE29700.1 hypothetical protein GLAREA_00860 [Glarea lozoyensis ATCC 20868]
MSEVPSIPRKPLHERSDSLSNSKSNSNNSSQNSLANKPASGAPGRETSGAFSSHSNTSANAIPRAAIRLVPSTPPQLLGTVTGREGPAGPSINDLNEARNHDREQLTNFGGIGSLRDNIYSRTPLPTHPSHILSAPGKGKDPAYATEFRTNLQAQLHHKSSGSSLLPGPSTHRTPQNVDSDTPPPISKVKPPAKKRLHIHKDNKTFSLLQDDQDVQSTDALQSPILSLSRTSSYDSLASQARHAKGRSNSIDSCLQSAPSTPSPDARKPISADHITTSSPWNYQLVGGIRKVPKTPDLKQREPSESPLPPVPEASDRPSGASHDLSTKLSFQSTQTTNSSTTSISETSNYKVFDNTFASTSDVALPHITSDSNYQLIGPPSVAPSVAPSEAPSEATSEPSSNYQLIGPPSEPSSSSNYQVIGPSSIASTASSVIHRPYTARSETISEAEENENYEVYGDPSPVGSAINLVAPQQKYSQESLVVPPLKPRNKRSNESFGYYKSRSRESLRTGSLTSITTVLSQQEAVRAIVGTGSLIQLPILSVSGAGPSSWAESSGNHPPRSQMNEHPHQWSSQLSTVLSVSEGGETGGRNSRDWASVSGRSSGAFPSTPSRSGSRANVMSISSSLALEEARSESLDPPEPAFMRGARRHQSSGSIQYIQDQDEYGDGITDMQDLRNRPSRTRLSGFFNSGSSDNGRTNTMRSTSSSRAGSIIATSSIPTWARLYYGSGERKYLGAPGSSTESTMGSRASSFRSGSPNTDHFPLSIYSPRRRPREGGRGDTRPSTSGSLQINPAPMPEGDNHDPYTSRRFRTWSMSSVWSPHLRMDRRAARHSVWDPPSVNWSADGSSFGRRNVQIIMFVAGFVFPFAWMIAAILPLPYNPVAEMREHEAETSSSQLDTSNQIANNYDRQFGRIDEKRFENAKWWRNLNRWMSVVGFLIIAAIIILVVVSIKEGWRSS